MMLAQRLNPQIFLLCSSLSASHTGGSNQSFTFLWKQGLSWDEASYSAEVLVTSWENK